MPASLTLSSFPSCTQGQDDSWATGSLKPHLRRCLGEQSSWTPWRRFPCGPRAWRLSMSTYKARLEPTGDFCTLELGGWLLLTSKLPWPLLGAPRSWEHLCWGRWGDNFCDVSLPGCSLHLCLGDVRWPKCGVVCKARPVLCWCVGDRTAWKEGGAV